MSESILDSHPIISDMTPRPELTPVQRVGRLVNVLKTNFSGQQPKQEFVRTTMGKPPDPKTILSLDDIIAELEGAHDWREATNMGTAYLHSPTEPLREHSGWEVDFIDLILPPEDEGGVVTATVVLNKGTRYPESQNVARTEPRVMLDYYRGSVINGRKDPGVIHVTHFSYTNDENGVIAPVTRLYIEKRQESNLPTPSQTQ